VPHKHLQQQRQQEAAAQGSTLRLLGLAVAPYMQLQ
jgi:hypothetical protein